MEKTYEISLTAEYFRDLNSEEIEKIFSLLPKLREELDGHAKKNAVEYADTEAASYLRYIVEIDKATEEGNKFPTMERQILETLFMKLINPESGFGTNRVLRGVVWHTVNRLFNSEVTASTG